MDDPVTKALARGMARLRKRRGLTVSAMAEAAGLSVQYVSMLESGQRSAKLSTVHDIATALRVSASELLKEGERKRATKTSGPEELAPLFEDLSDQQTTQLIKVVREIRDLIAPRRKGRA